MKELLMNHNDKYRVLENGEEIKPGDEAYFVTGSSEYWSLVCSWFHGQIYNYPADNSLIRRRIEQPPPPVETVSDSQNLQKTIWKLEETVERLTAENRNLSHDLKLQRALNAGNHGLQTEIETLEKEVALTKEKNENLREELLEAYRTIADTLKRNQLYEPVVAP